MPGLYLPILKQSLIEDSVNSGTNSVTADVIDFMSAGSLLHLGVPCGFLFVP